MAYSDPAKAREYQNAWRRKRYAADPQYRLAKLADSKSYRRKNIAVVARRDSDKQRLRISGWTRVEYDAAFAAQFGLCAICHAEPGVAGLHADHCHRTGKKRALLCFPCNTWLGTYEKDPELTAVRLAYLKEHE